MTLIRLEPVAYGMGPLGKALHVAQGLRNLDPSLKLELITSDAFRAAVPAGLFDAVNSSFTATNVADLVVCVMNSEAARRCAVRGERFVFVDSLAWLWDKPLAVPSEVEAYFFQDLPMFPATPSNISPFGNRAIPTGPIVSTRKGPESLNVELEYDLLVSLGGVDNFEVSISGGTARYHEVIGRQLRKLHTFQPEKTIVYGNRSMLGAFPETIPGNGSQIAFLGSAQKAKVVTLSPGLTSILELASSGIGFSLLPPQNYSQAKIAHRMRHLVPIASWAGVLPRWLGESQLPENVGSQIMRALISDNFVNPAAIEGLELAITADGFQVTEELRGRLGLDANGTELVVSWIANRM